MKRPFVSFMLTVVLPAAAAMAGARYLAHAAWREVAVESHTRVARMALATMPVQAEARLTTVARTAGYHATLYRDGVRWVSTEPDFGPGRIPEAVIPRLSAVRGVLAGDTPAEGVYLATGVRGAPAATAPPLVALAAPRETPQPLLQPPVLLVMALLLVFGSLTGWIQLARRDLGERRLALGGLMAPALVPTLATLVFFIHVDRSFQIRASETGTRDLTRGLSVSTALDEELDPRAVHALTGFHATRVRGGAVDGSSFAGGADAIAALPGPPTSFTSSGTVETPEGHSLYLARRLAPDVFLVLTALPPESEVANLRRELFLLGLGLAGWWILVALGAWLVSRRDGAGSLSASPDLRDPRRA